MENQKDVRVGFWMGAGGGGGGIRGGYGNTFSRIGKGREGLLGSSFWEG